MRKTREGKGARFVGTSSESTRAHLLISCAVPLSQTNHVLEQGGPSRFVLELLFEHFQRCTSLLGVDLVHQLEGFCLIKRRMNLAKTTSALQVAFAQQELHACALSHVLLHIDASKVVHIWWLRQPRRAKAQVAAKETSSGCV